MNILNIPYGIPGSGMMTYPGININYEIPKPVGIPVPMGFPPISPMGYSQFGISQMIQPGYNFKSNDLMYLGSTLLHKINDDQIRINQEIEERIKNSKDDRADKSDKSEKTKSSKEKDIFKKISKLIDSKEFKADISDSSINELFLKLDSNSNLKDTSDTPFDPKKNSDALKRFIRTVKFISATQKLLSRAPKILKELYKNKGIDVEKPEVKEYLGNIEKGVKQTIALEKLLKESNIILNDDQNAIVLEFLKKVLEGFTLGT